MHLEPSSDKAPSGDRRSAVLRRVVAMDPRDNVANALEELQAGDRFEVDGRSVPVRMAVPLGHKVAIARIPAGGVVIKYGESIGHARDAIEPGEHVHSHNVASLFTDWLASRANPSEHS